ncbi:MAG: FdhF/YdeP family oxidoreductase [Alphaproteobacteria bacterium]|nr:FdhF/YdeP family oxidoreductase [Alphaproteobacteria bacterium]PHX99869.1 MAG: CbbBc protein [Rhodospirillaceae bacterium]
MSKSPTKPSFARPAGGWAALKSSAEHLISAGNPLTGVKSLLNVNQPEGFDCPGCAWGDPKHTSSFEFCESGVKAVSWEATSKRCTPEVMDAHTVTWLAEQDDCTLESLGRLTHPMIYDAPSDTYKAIDWDEAFAVVGRELRALDHPDQALFYTSGRTSNEAAFLWQLFVREFGTNNLPDCSNMCHEASGVALGESIGIGKGTILLEDMKRADAIFIFGQNPGTNHPRMLGDLKKAARRGAKIVTVNPLRERGLERFADPKNPIDMVGNAMGGEGTTLTSLYLQIQVGGDLALLKGMMKVIIAADETARAAGGKPVLDDAFIATHTYGLDALIADLKAEPWERILAQSGVSRDEIARAADIYINAGRVICTWAMGLTQHAMGVETIQQIINLLLLRGNIGRPGTGPCPVRGHSNVQGDRTMGITELPKQEFLDSLRRVFGFTPPSKPGVNTVEAIAAMRDGKAKALLAMGGNFAAACPDSDVTWAGLRALNLTVHVSTKLNRSHLVHGKTALIFPALGRTEIDTQKTGRQAITVEDSMSMVHASQGMNLPASDQLRSEPWIIAGIAMATLPTSKVPWATLRDDYRLIRAKIEAVFADFENFNERILRAGGFYLGNSAKERIWKTATSKANFIPACLPTQTTREAAQAQTQDRVFTLTTFRAHDQYNTTVYARNDRYRGIKNKRRVVFINADDLAAMNFTAGQHVDLSAVWHDSRSRVAKNFELVPYNIPRGCLGAYFPETNVLVPLDSHGARSGTPTNKSILVTLVAAR